MSTGSCRIMPVTTLTSICSALFWSQNAMIWNKSSIRWRRTGLFNSTTTFSTTRAIKQLSATCEVEGRVHVSSVDWPRAHGILHLLLCEGHQL
eukprot:356338-Chlamydomonas_euryale.AAC.2